MSLAVLAGACILTGLLLSLSWSLTGWKFTESNVGAGLTVVSSVSLVGKTRGRRTGMKSVIVRLETTGDISFSGAALTGRRGPVNGPIISPLVGEGAVGLTILLSEASEA